MEDDIVIRSEALDSFSFAAVFDGHAGSSSVKFLRYFMQDQFLKCVSGGDGDDGFLIGRSCTRDALRRCKLDLC